MKISFRGRKGTIKFQGNEGRKLVEHIQNGGSLGDILIPKVVGSVERLDAEVPLQLKAKENADAGDH